MAKNESRTLKLLLVSLNNQKLREYSFKYLESTLTRIFHIILLGTPMSTSC